MRISFGSSSSKSYKGDNKVIKELCAKIAFKLDCLKLLSFDQLDKFSDQEPEVININGEGCFLTVYTKKSSKSEILIVVQGFYHTWLFPNYFSSNGIGKMFADGFIIKSNGEKLDCPMNMLFSYW